MHRLLCISLLLTFSSSSLVAQDSLKNSIAIHFGMNRLDFFTGVQYSKKINQLNAFSSFEVGVNRTIFQKRFFPRISFGASYFMLNKQKVSIGPQLSWSYSVLKINKNTDHLNQWNEIYLGAKIEIGSRLRFTNVISGGWMNERYFSQLTNKRAGVNSMGFYVNIGLSYGF